MPRGRIELPTPWFSVQSLSLGAVLTDQRLSEIPREHQIRNYFTLRTERTQGTVPGTIVGQSRLKSCLSLAPLDGSSGTFVIGPGSRT